MRRNRGALRQTLQRVIAVGLLLTLALVYGISLWSGRISTELEASTSQLTDGPSDYQSPPPTTSPVSADRFTESYTSFSGTSYSLSNRSFLETFSGRPNRPLPWRSTETWDISIHSRDVETWRQLLPMEAHGGTDCSSHPDTHRVREYADSVFQCDDHLLTAIHGEAYALAYLTPAVVTKFSAEEPTTIRFEVSTTRSSSRDWIDLWVTPFNNNLIYPLESWLPDLTGEPRQALHIRMDGSWNSRWTAEIIDDFQAHEIAGTDAAWQGYETFITPSSTARETFELRISPTHIRFGLPDYNFWWIDTELQVPLGWQEGIVQFGHHSHSPEGACDDKATGCSPNTWHWDNIAIDPATSFTLIPADARYVDATTERTVYFNQPSPRNARLRFAGIGNELSVSFDGGTTWRSAEMQAQANLADEKFKSYWMTIPLGTTNVTFRGENWWGGPWHVRDISIWNR